MSQVELSSFTGSQELQHKLALSGAQCMLEIKDVMSKQVITIASGATLFQAAQTMVEHSVSCLLVVEDDQIVGLLSESDFLHGIAEQPTDYLNRRVANRMSHPVETISCHRALFDAMQIMSQMHVRRLPVVDEGRLVGIITQTDLTRALRSWDKLRSVAEVVNTPVPVVQCGASIAEAARVMTAHSESYVVVMKDDHPAGILTERDILQKISEKNQDSTLILVQEIMSSPLVSIDSSFSVFSASRMMDEKHIHRLVVMEDGVFLGIITQGDVLKVAQEKLYAEQEESLELMNQSCSCIFLLDTEGATLHVNPAILRLLEIQEPDALIGRPFLTHPFCSPAMQDRLLKDIEQNGTFDCVELPLKTAQGNTLYVNVVATQMRDIYGRISGIQGMIHDITAKREAEQALTVAHEELKAANQELKEMQTQVVQNEKMASIGQLAAGVAHELNTPVGYVASNFQTLEKYVSQFRTLLQQYDHLIEQLDPEQQAIRQTLDDIQRFRRDKKIDFMLDDLQSLFDESSEGLHRVTDIVKNLKDFSRIDGNAGFDDYCLNNGIKSTLLVINNEIKYDADVVQDLSDVPIISCNGGQINQVILNILVNAAQAMRSQERSDKGTITIKTSTSENEVICEISDNGPGMSAETRKKIFEPFFTTKPPGKGTGLGLSVSYDIIVKKHSGTLQVDSAEGQGTTFTIRLPILSEPNTTETR